MKKIRLGEEVTNNDTREEISALIKGNEDKEERNQKIIMWQTVEKLKRQVTVKN